MRSSLEVAAPLFAPRQDVSPIDSVSSGNKLIYVSPLRPNSLDYEHAVPKQKIQTTQRSLAAGVELETNLSSESQGNPA